MMISSAPAAALLIGRIAWPVHRIFCSYISFLLVVSRIYEQKVAKVTKTESPLCSLRFLLFSPSRPDKKHIGLGMDAGVVGIGRRNPEITAVTPGGDGIARGVGGHAHVLTQGVT